jgi:c-di-GMP-binding flagellar brake protein YcgR
MRWTVSLENTTGFPTKRRYKRVPVMCRVGFFSNKAFKFAEGVTLGEGGMLLRCESPLRVDEEIEIYFHLPEGEFIRTRAVVRYNIDQHQNNAAGIQFVELSPRYQKAIREYVKNR